MKEEERTGLISLYSSLIPALEQRDVLKIGRLNKTAIQNASLFQDEDSIAAAVIIYAIMKLIERAEFNVKPLRILVYHCSRHLERKKDKAYEKELAKIFKLITRTDKNLKMFLQEVVKQARIKKGGSLHDQGLSVGRAASLLGISQWELMAYVGKTTLSEIYPGKISEKKRIAQAMELFE